MGSSLWVVWAAEVEPKKKLELLNPDILEASAAIVAVLLVGAGLLSVLQRWKRRQLADQDIELGNVNSYRAMLASGELSREEYDRILKRVGQRTLGKIPAVETAPPQVPPKESDPPQPNQ